MTGSNGLQGLEAQLDDFGLEVCARLAITGVDLSDDDTARLIQSLRDQALSTQSFAYFLDNPSTLTEETFGPQGFM